MKKHAQRIFLALLALLTAFLVCSRLEASRKTTGEPIRRHRRQYLAEIDLQGIDLRSAPMLDIRVDLHSLRLDHLDRLVLLEDERRHLCARTEGQ